MSEFNDRFTGLSPEQRQDRYRRLAEAALLNYTIDEATLTLLQHNSGISYRVETPRHHQRFLLKIAQPIGESTDFQPNLLHSALVWVTALARETMLVLQEPVLNRRGELVTAVAFEDLSEPCYCSIQRWIDGERLAGHFAPAHAFGVGAMMAELHHHSSQWTRVGVLEARELDATWLAGKSQTLSRVVEDGILSGSEWATVELACERIQTIMGCLGRGAQRWGPIHGDLHQENLVFSGEEVCPIDFEELTIGHYMFDLGTMLYHLMYLPTTVRQALFDGYQSTRVIGEVPDMTAEAFLCAAALGNLAFQVTISKERTSSLTVRNLREFATKFCQRLVNSEPFSLA